MTTPALYRTKIRHARSEPIRNEFEYLSYSWYVDIDDLPVLPAALRPFARFRADDHLDRPGESLRTRVDTFLAEHHIDLQGGRVTALMNARVLGHVFNPLSLFWCHGPTGELECVIAEVHNTYGQRHAYLVRTDGQGRGSTEKAFYVSPFNDVSGTYRMTFPEPGEDLDVGIELRSAGHAPFTATMQGTRRPATTANVVRAQLRSPLAPLLVAARIRRQGIALWARGLPVVPRPRNVEPQEAHR